MTAVGSLTMISDLDSYLMEMGCTRYDPVTYVCAHPEKSGIIRDEVRESGYVCVPYEKGQETAARGKERGLAIARLISPGKELVWFVAFVPEDNY
jgi:hypothetical protein